MLGVCDAQLAKAVAESTLALLGGLLGQHIQLEDGLSCPGVHERNVALLNLLLMLVSVKVLFGTVAAHMLSLMHLVFENCSKLFHDFVRLSIVSSLAQVVVGEEFVEDLGVGVIKCPVSLVKVIVTHGFSVVHLLHVVSRIHVVLDLLCRLLMHGVEQHVFDLWLARESKLVDDTLAKHLHEKMAIVGGLYLLHKVPIQHTCLVPQTHVLIDDLALGLLGNLISTFFHQGLQKFVLVVILVLFHIIGEPGQVLRMTD